MADYIYLLENRLSPAQRTALRNVRDIARSKSLTVFLVGGAVRDLTSGSPVRDLDVVVQGNALKLKKDIEKADGVITGESDLMQALYVRFPGNVRMEVGSTLSVTFPKPGKAVAKSATILDDLRRRDFTANAMALSLNEGSYGLLMDPLNGVADIENRELRLASNYGFIEDPVRMIRAARLMARLGWTLDEKTQTRYETGREEGYIGAMQDVQRGYELEEIVHEEDPLRILKRLEADGWMAHLAPYWTSAKVNIVELDKMRDTLAQLQMQGIHPDTAAVQFPLITSKLTAKEVASLKQGFPRQGFVKEIEALEEEAKEVATQLGSKAAALPSQAWRLIMSAKPEAVLQVAYSTRSASLQAKFKSFFTEWPAARQKMPYTLMQEMRIVPELAGYDELLEKLFFELMDGKLSTIEEMKAFLEPYSPPAPPPPVNMRRARASKKEPKVSKAKLKKAAKAEAESEEEADLDAEIPDLPDLDELEDLDEEIDLDIDSDSEPEEDEEAEPEPAPVTKAPAPKKAAKEAVKVAVETPKAKVPAGKPAPEKPAAKAVAVPKPAAKPAVTPASKPTAKKSAPPAKKVAASKKAPAPVAKKAVVKSPVKAVAKKPIKLVPKVAAKKPAKPAPKALPKPVAKKAVVKAPAKKIAAKTVAKPVAKKAAPPVKGKTKAAPVKSKSGKKR